MLLSWSCKKQTAVSHISTEATLFHSMLVCEWKDLRGEFMGHQSLTCWRNQLGDPQQWTKQRKTKEQVGHAGLFVNFDFVTPNAHSSSFRASLHVFEDREAVIRVALEGRSNVGHVSRTHRVDLDWLFDRINFGTTIQTEVANTNRQSVDVLTKVFFFRKNVERK